MSNNIGILDPHGVNKNPLNDEPYSIEYKKLAKIWSTFPAYKIANDMIDAIKNNQVVLCIASTGSGKTVLVPKYTLHAFDYKGKIAITLPKQTATRSAAEFAAKTLDVNIGREVGYQYKGSSKGAKSNDTQLLYATDGTIVARLLNDPMLKEFNAVIVDEAHERSVQIDFLLYLLRETIKLRPDFRVIIMSATINADIFRNYFSSLNYKEINISGQRTFPIESIFLERPLEYKKIIDKGFNIIVDLLKEDIKNNGKNGANDILFFITSANEAFDVCKQLDSYVLNNKGKQSTSKITSKGNVFCVEFFAAMDPRRQELAQDKVLYQEQGKYSRKLVVSTNVAESSLTIDGIKYVIDSGYELSSSYDPIHRAKKLDRQLITHAQAKQRMGRGGRTGPGICYHMYTQTQFKKDMKKFPEPDIRVSDISGECLRLLNLDKIGNIKNLLNVFTNFIEPPRENYIRASIDNLKKIGAIEDESKGGKITKVGKLIAQIGGSNPMYAFAIILGKIYRCSHEIIKIVSYIEASKTNMGEIFHFPKKMLIGKEEYKDKDKRQKALKGLNDKFNKKIKKFEHKYGDHLSLYNIIKQYSDLVRKYPNKPDKINQWCYDNFLKKKSLDKGRMFARKSEFQIKRLVGNNLDPKTIDILFRDDINSLPIDDKIMTCLLIAFRTNTGILRGNAYKTQYSGDIRTTLNDNSFLQKHKQKPKHIFYSELFITMGNASLNIVSKIPTNLIKLLS
jgi:pre-mRNA-splicing factor ATP-dependent RNA helicase DHX15/PRP43